MSEPLWNKEDMVWVLCVFLTLLCFFLSITFYWYGYTAGQYHERVLWTAPLEKFMAGVDKKVTVTLPEVEKNP